MPSLHSHGKVVTDLMTIVKPVNHVNFQEHDYVHFGQINHVLFSHNPRGGLVFNARVAFPHEKVLINCTSQYIQGQ